MATGNVVVRNVDINLLKGNVQPDLPETKKKNREYLWKHNNN